MQFVSILVIANYRGNNTHYFSEQSAQHDELYRYCQ